MKKFFAIAILAAALAACNNSGESKTETDTTAVKPDTTSTMSTDTTNKMMTDTTAKKDTSAKK